MENKINDIRTTATSQVLSLLLFFLVFLFIQDTLTAIRVLFGMYLLVTIINIWAGYIQRRDSLIQQMTREMERRHRDNMGKPR